MDKVFPSSKKAEANPAVFIGGRVDVEMYNQSSESHCITSVNPAQRPPRAGRPAQHLPATDSLPTRPAINARPYQPVMLRDQLQSCSCSQSLECTDDPRYRVEETATSCSPSIKKAPAQGLETTKRSCSAKWRPVQRADDLLSKRIIPAILNSQTKPQEELSYAT
ncbi:hypothetical protein CEK25_002413 [Fusarium fujikuroi]|nr:hypothetical protein CEK25_002413 [Fusarium fujikuroi]